MRDGTKWQLKNLSASHGTCDGQMHLIWNHRELRENAESESGKGLVWIT